MTDEPLGSHVLELQVADVVKETDDARSLVFTVPAGVDIPADASNPARSIRKGALDAITARVRRVLPLIVRLVAARLRGSAWRSWRRWRRSPG